jgi:hypothetical protein
MTLFHCFPPIRKHPRVVPPIDIFLLLRLRRGWADRRPRTCPGTVIALRSAKQGFCISLPHTRGFRQPETFSALEWLSGGYLECLFFPYGKLNRLIGILWIQITDRRYKWNGLWSRRVWTSDTCQCNPNWWKWQSCRISQLPIIHFNCRIR